MAGDYSGGFRSESINYINGQRYPLTREKQLRRY